MEALSPQPSLLNYVTCNVVLKCSSRAWRVGLSHQPAGKTTISEQSQKTLQTRVVKSHGQLTQRPDAFYSLIEDAGQRRLPGGQPDLMKYIWVIFAELYEQYLPNFTSNDNCSEQTFLLNDVTVLF